MKKSTIILLIPLLLAATGAELALLIWTAKSARQFVDTTWITPGKLAAHLTAAAEFAGNDNWDAAITEFTQALVVDATSTEAFQGRGRAYAEKGEYDLAIKDFTSAIELDGTDAEPYEWRGYAYTQQGKLEEGIKDYDKAIELDADPDNPSAYERRAYARMMKGDLDAAIEDYSAALRRKGGEDASLAAGRGYVYAQKGDWEHAIADYDIALRLSPKDGKVFGARATAHAQRKEWDAALRDYDEALRLDPADLELRTSRGIAYAERAQWEPALADFKEAIRLGPDKPQGYNSEAWLLATSPAAKIRNGREAVTLATKACELTHWKQGSIIDTLAAAHAEAGDFDQAIKFQKDALAVTAKNSPDRLEMQERLALYLQHQPYRDHPKP